MERQKAGELFPDIAEAAQKDIVYRRREKHKKTSGILDNRKFARQLDGLSDIKKAEEPRRKKREIIKNDPYNNPNNINLRGDKKE